MHVQDANLNYNTDVQGHYFVWQLAALAAIPICCESVRTFYFVFSIH